LKKLIAWNVIFIFLIFYSTLTFSQSVGFYNKTFGHIHLKPYSGSASVTNISCGEKLQKDMSAKLIEQDWEAVVFGDKKGYVFKGHLSQIEPPCLQSDYPIFFQALELDLTEIFLWGKLSDHFIEFEAGR
jgi:hypothetical protein